MNFFQHQDDARRKTGLLIVLFCAAVAGIIVMVTLLIAVTVWLGAGDSVSIAQYGLGYHIDGDLLLKTSLCVTGVIAAVILFKWQQLKGGGKVIAERLGGTLVNPNSVDLAERQLLNVVEEMAIAAGMPVPPVYLLNERGINAFAAGHSQANAVIGITHGAIKKLNRAQLQGVIAHEFSHILHGDMLINLRLIAVLSGILFIGQSGHILLRSGHHRHSKKGSQGALLGLGFVMIGFVGTFFGKMIKAAVSRQREFLADASAVQYTRNPGGISEALQVIGGASDGSLISASKAEENSHLFFSNGLNFNLNAASVMSTHPPLSERIKRIQPTWNGKFISSKAIDDSDSKPSQTTATSQQASTSNIAAAALIAAVDQVGQINSGAIASAEQLLTTIPVPLRNASRDGYYARATIFALLLDNNDQAIAAKQLASLTAETGLRERTKELLPHLQQLGSEQYLVLVELCVPALKQQSAHQYQTFQQLIKDFIDADGKIELFEWMLQELLQHYLAGEFSHKDKHDNSINSLRHVDVECFEVLSMLALYGHGDRNKAQHALEQAIFILEMGSGFSLPKQAVELTRLSANFTRLRRLKPKAKQTLLKGCATCIKADGTVNKTEQELFRIFSALLDCPMQL